KYINVEYISLPTRRSSDLYKAGYHLREAKLSLALGLPQTFEEHVTQCVAASAASVGEESAAHGWLLLELAEAYRQYGNLRISAEDRKSTRLNSSHVKN